MAEITLEGKTILLGITGGIAAYKSAELCSRLVKLGAAVDVVMTEAATKFITPLTFEAITHRKAHADMWAGFEPTPHHISLAERADIAVIAPATANTLAKMANGIADNVLTSVLLATRAPILIAPAMNENMWLHPATQSNIEILESRKIKMVGPESGNLACGTSGTGRMAEPEQIVASILDALNTK